MRASREERRGKREQRTRAEREEREQVGGTGGEPGDQYLPLLHYRPLGGNIRVQPPNLSTKHSNCPTLLYFAIIGREKS